MHDSIVANTSKLRSSNHNWFYDSHYRFLNNARWYKLLPVKQKTASSNLALPAMTTKQLGNIGEAKTLAKLVSMNVPVSVIMRKQT